MGKLKRVLLPVLLGLAGYYALFGGEYSVFEVRETRDRIGEERSEVERLHGRIDSLRSRADSLETDSAVLERVARERFGMVREGEVLYRFAEPKDTTDSTGTGGSPGGG